MSDFNSSLPIRTENAGDAIVKVADATIPSQQLKVNSDGSVNITDNSGSLTVDANNLDIRDLAFATDKVDASGSTVALDAPTLAALESITVQNGSGASAVNIQDGGNSITVDGTVELGATSLAALESITVQNGTGAAAVNIQDGGNSITVDGTVELGATSLAALESITVQNGAGASAVNIQDGGNSLTVDATDLDIRDLTHVTDSVKIGDGTDFLAINSDGSLNVVVQEDVGTEVVDFNTSAALAGAASSNHDRTFATASKLYQVFASASGKLKIEVQVETGSATGVFNTKVVAFNSTANPNIDINLSKYVAIPAGARVRVIRTNKDNQAQDVYSTIVGILG